MTLSDDNRHLQMQRCDTENARQQWLWKRKKLNETENAQRIVLFLCFVLFCSTCYETRRLHVFLSKIILFCPLPRRLGEYCTMEMKLLPSRCAR